MNCHNKAFVPEFVPAIGDHPDPVGIIEGPDPIPQITEGPDPIPQVITDGPDPIGGNQRVVSTRVITAKYDLNSGSVRVIVNWDKSQIRPSRKQTRIEIEKKGKNEKKKGFQAVGTRQAGREKKSSKIRLYAWILSPN